NCYSFITKDSSPPIPAVTSAARKSATPTTQRNCAPTQEGPRDQTLLSSFLAISSHAEPYARQLEEKRLNPPAPHPENPRLERNLRPAKRVSISYAVFCLKKKNGAYISATATYEE